MTPRDVATRQRRCGLSAITMLVGVVLSGCGGGEAQMTHGHALYAINCATCHGDGGAGDGPMASQLPTPPADLIQHLGHHPRAQLVKIIQTGVPPAMPPAALSEEEVQLVIEYAWTLVPDSLLAGLREMQRLAEMGMEMNMGDSTTMGGGMSGSGMEMDTSAATDTTSSRLPGG